MSGPPFLLCAALAMLTYLTAQAAFFLQRRPEKFQKTVKSLRE